MNPDPVNKIIGASKAISAVKDLVKKVADRPTTVLILGESGTGKESVARAIHECSARRARPFIPFNCAAFVESLLESELFGHERGAFTGAVMRKPGLFERADGGTLFLDEIGEIPAAVQGKLLRVLQEREFERVGGQETVKVDVRVVSATNRDLQREVDEGRFRHDLYYRIKVFPVQVPPLRERMDDLPALVEHFIASLAPLTNSVVRSIDDAALARLYDYEWPGNVRELWNVVERSLVLTEGEAITPDALPSEILSGGSDDRAAGTGSPPTPHAREAEIVEATLGAYRTHADKAPDGRPSHVFQAVKAKTGISQATDGIRNRTNLLRLVAKFQFDERAFEGESLDVCRAIACDIETILGKTMTPAAIRRALEARGADQSRSIVVGAHSVLPHPHRGLVDHLVEVACGGGDNHRCVPATPGLMLDRALEEVRVRLQEEGIGVIDIHADISHSIGHLLTVLAQELLEAGALTALPAGAPTSTWIKNRVAVTRPRCMVLVRDIDFTLNALPASESRGELVRELCRVGLPVVFTSMRPVRRWCVVESVASARELQDVGPGLVADDWDTFVASYELDDDQRARYLEDCGGSPRIFEAMAQEQDVARLREGFAHDIWTRLSAFRSSLAVAAGAVNGELEQEAVHVLRWARVLDAGNNAPLDPELAPFWRAWAAAGAAGQVNALDGDKP